MARDWEARSPPMAFFLSRCPYVSAWEAAAALAKSWFRRAERSKSDNRRSSASESCFRSVVVSARAICLDDIAKPPLLSNDPRSLSR